MYLIQRAEQATLEKETGYHYYGVCLINNGKEYVVWNYTRRNGQDKIEDWDRYWGHYIKDMNEAKRVYLDKVLDALGMQDNSRTNEAHNKYAEDINFLKEKVKRLQKLCVSKENKFTKLHEEVTSMGEKFLTDLYQIDIT